MKVPTWTTLLRLPTARISALMLCVFLPLPSVFAQNNYAFAFAIGGAVKAPLGIATDTADNIYVADTGNNRIVKFDRHLNFLGKIGSTGAGNGQFSNPTGVAVDSSGNIYVADSSNNRIQKFDSSGHFLWTIGTYGTGNGQFQHPYGVAVDSSGSKIYVADSSNNRIQEIDSSGNYVSQFGSKGAASNQFSNPTGIAVDGNGNIYVVDQGNDAVKQFSSAQKWVWTAGSSSTLSSPTSVAVDSAGNVDVSDTGSDIIRQYDTNGNYLRYFGSRGTSSGTFADPYGVAVDSTGNIFVTDVNVNNRIQEFDNQGNYLWQFGSGSHGSVDGQFSDPTGVAVDSNGYIYVTDSLNATAGNSRFQKFDSTGLFVWAIGSRGVGANQFVNPAGVAVDSSGYVYIADTYGLVYKYSSQGDYIGAIGSAGSGNGQFNGDSGVALDSSGNIYVADNNNYRIQKFDPTGAFVWTHGTQGNGNGQFQHPSGVAVDSSGSIYVADSSNNRIQKFDGNFTFKWAVGSYGSNTGQFEGPLGLAVDGNGNIYVADTSNNRIQKFDTNGNYITEISPDAWGDAYASQVSSVAVDAAGGVYITDITNNRVVVFDTMANPVPILTSINPDQVTAGSGDTQITLKGTNFVSGSTVLFGSTPLTTSYVSATQLTAKIPAAQLTAAGVANIAVVNPTPGGGLSNTLAFVIGTNPVPSVSSISPSRIAAGSAATTLIVSGANFVNGATVRFGGKVLATTFVSTTELTATVDATLLANAGKFGVNVNNPKPKGGNSDSLTFTVINPTPVLTGVSPAQVTAGAGATTITLTGSGFTAHSKARFKGAGLTTTYVSATQLTASIPASKLVVPGDFDITVSNTAPGGGTSASFTFSVLSPIPTLSSLSPNQAPVGSAATTLTVNGTNFVNGAVVSFGGTVLVTTFVSTTQLTAVIPANLLAKAGAIDVTVTNPAPGGGDGNSLTFTVH